MKYTLLHIINIIKLTIMKTLFCIILLCVLSIIGIKLYAQRYKKESNNFVQQPKTNSKQQPKETPFTFTDNKGKQYVIYITSNGVCFILRTSKNTGKDYRYYLDVDICREIYKVMGIEYKPKVKVNK